MQKIRKADEVYDPEKDIDDYDNTLFCIPQNSSAMLLPFLQKYHSDLENEYLAKYSQFKSALDAIIEGHAREANVEDIEYKAHALFKYGCVEDLMKACRLSIKTGEDVTIYCD